MRSKGGDMMGLLPNVILTAILSRNLKISFQKHIRQQSHDELHFSHLSYQEKNTLSRVKACGRSRRLRSMRVNQESEKKNKYFITLTLSLLVDYSNSFRFQYRIAETDSHIHEFLRNYFLPMYTQRIYLFWYR